MNFVNLTPHAITVAKGDKFVTFPPSGKVARVESYQKAEPPIGGFEVKRTTFGDVQNIPEAQTDTIYIVSAMVLAQCQRPDVVAPDTGPTAIRNEKGHIVAVLGFVV